MCFQGYSAAWSPRPVAYGVLSPPVGRLSGAPSARPCRLCAHDRRLYGFRSGARCHGIPIEDLQGLQSDAHAGGSGERMSPYSSRMPGACHSSPSNFVVHRRDSPNILCSYPCTPFSSFLHYFASSGRFRLDKLCISSLLSQLLSSSATNKVSSLFATGAKLSQ